MQTLDVGETAIIRTEWFDGNGDAANPSAIDLMITKPDGTVLPVVHKGTMVQGATTDVWLYAQLVDAEGVWRYKPSGVVAALAVTQPERYFIVGPGSASQQGPCEPWCTWDEVTACTTQSFATVDSAKRERIIDSVSGILYDLSGRHYSGICETTSDLCLTCMVCAPSCCSCEPSEQIDLGVRAPVWGVLDVTIDGVILAASKYRLLGRRWLVRTDGNAWPRASNLADPTAFRVRFVYGRQIPPGGREAAATFALEWAKACVGAACEIPKRILTINREGITFGILDAQSFLKEGRTGVYMVDEWLTSDKLGRKSRPGMFIPGASAVRSIGT